MSIEKLSSSRSRAPNFSKEEQLVLLGAIESFTSIIECKKTDHIKQSQKQAAWRKVAEIYNANTKGVPRTVENLISCYRNTKSKVKKQQSEAKMLLQDTLQENAFINAIDHNGQDWDAVSKEINKPIELCQSGFEELKKKTIKEENRLKRKTMCTGGGPPSPNGDDNPLLKLKKFIEPQIDGLFTAYDADADLMEQFHSTKPVEERKRPIEISFMDFGKEKSSVSLVTSKHTETNAVFKTLLEEPCASTSHCAETEMDNIAPSPNRLDTIRKKKTLELDFDSQINIEHTPSRMDMIRKKKAPELDFDKDTVPRPKKNNVNLSFINLSAEKQELVQLQKQQIQLELSHKEKIYKLELEDKIEEIKFNKEKRQKELYLLDLKIKNMEQ